MVWSKLEASVPHSKMLLSLSISNVAHLVNMG